MKKKFLIFMTVVVVVMLTLTVVACNKNESNTPIDNNTPVDGNECIHSFGAWVTVDEPTCTTAGSKKQTCSLCGKEETGSIDATGHIWGKWEISKEPTCKETGTKKRVCENCNLPETETIETTDHNFVDGVCKTCGQKTATEGLQYTLNEDEESYAVTSIGTATDTAIVISSSYNGKPVTSIGVYAFYGCEELTSIVIPDSVTSIEHYAFWYCPLKSINIPKSVTSIGKGVFHNCSQLTEITVDSNNPVYQSVNNCLIEKTTKTLLYGCNNSILPTDGSVEIIGEYAFTFCNGITSVIIPDSVTSIKEGAFNNCIGITSITIGKNVASIGEKVFYGCSKIASITVDENNKTYHSISNCLIKTATKTLLLGCNNSTIPTDGSITSIADCAFMNCINLTVVTIPEGVKSIGGSAFAYCTALNKIDFLGTVTEWQNITKDNYWDNGTDDYTVYCTNGEITKDGTVTIYKEEEPLISTNGLLFELNDDEESYSVIAVGTATDADIVIPATFNGKPVTIIGFGAFENRSHIKSVTIPDSVEKIDDFAFTGCSGLTTIKIKDSLGLIGRYAFKESGLVRIEFDGSIEEWDRVGKSYNWDYGTGDFTVYCIDGEIKKDGTKIYY